MHFISSIFGGIFEIIALICSIIILVDAFKNEVWKGLVSLFCCGLYFIYYALFEFEHENKWLIVFGSFLGHGIASALYWRFR